MNAFRLATLVLVLTATSAAAQAPFAAKSVTLVIGFGSGGGYDLWGRTVARHIGRHLPGAPTVIPQNMPGAGSYVAASFLYGAAPKDGSVFGIISREVALGPLTGAPGARFDATRFSWLGSTTKEHSVCIANQSAAVKSAADLREKVLIVGDNGPGASSRTHPLVLNDLLGFKFKLVSGFRSSADVFLAMERGEVDGICESLDSIVNRRPDWISSGKVRVLLQGGSVRHPDLKDVPTATDLAQDDAQRAVLAFAYAGQDVGRPFVAPPDLPADRLTMLRAAFAATMKDAAFVDEAAKAKLDLEPEDGDALAARIRAIYATPRPIIDRVGALIK